MRLVVKSDLDKTSKLSSLQTKTQLLIIATNLNKDLITDSIYRDSYEHIDGRRSYVEDKLAIAYKNKCAYCERITKADIEHYRPKKGVKDVVHDGYYWLCYEWTNLLPSCINCNREGAKHSHFPILGPRVTKPTFLHDNTLNEDSNKANNNPLRLENPYLLHPEVDDPVVFFKFKNANDGTGIRIIGIDQQGRGERTIEICKLNRMELTLDRVHNVIDPFIESIEAVFVLLSRNEITKEGFINSILNQINVLKLQANNVEKTNTLLRKYIIKDQTNFDEIVIPYLATGCQSIVSEAFKN